MNTKTVEIAIGCDHNGYELKEQIKQYLLEKGYSVIDFGVNNTEPVLYPEIANKVCREILSRNIKRAILICGTGAGMAIAANKVHGIRAVCIHDAYTAERARASNDAQVATLGSFVIGFSLAKKNLDIWLESEFEGGRSAPKVALINEMDETR